MSLFNEYEFKKCVARYKDDRHAVKFNCRDQFMVMSLAQFTDSVSEWAIGTSVSFSRGLYSSGIKVIHRTTLAEANGRNWRKYQDFICPQDSMLEQLMIASATIFCSSMQKKWINLVPRHHYISKSIEQALFPKADIRELYNHPQSLLMFRSRALSEQLTL